MNGSRPRVATDRSPSHCPGIRRELGFSNDEIKLIVERVRREATASKSRPQSARVPFE